MHSHIHVLNNDTLTLKRIALKLPCCRLEKYTWPAALVVMIHRNLGTTWFVQRKPN
jgi:hypothetical protein